MELSQPVQEETEEAREGTAAHWVCAQSLVGVTEFPQAAPNGVEITEEMVDAGAMWVDDVATRMVPGAIMNIERTFRVPEVHEQCWGTPDLDIVVPQLMKLYIDDFKFGHKPVDPEWNWQLACYTSGRLSELRQQGILINEIEWTIIQPRAYGHPPIKKWSLNLHTIHEMESQLRAAAVNAMSPNPKMVPSAESCRNCRAAGSCPALQYVTLALTDKAFQATPMNLDAASAARELAKLDEACDVMIARLDALKEQAAAMIKRGERFPGWALEPASGRTVWNIPDDQVIQIGTMFGASLAKAPKAITPTQAKKLLAPDVLSAYSTRQNGSLKLTKTKGWKE